MSGFFKEETFKAEEADQPWKKSELDAFLEDYLSGRKGIKELALKFGRNKKAILRRVEKWTYNEKNSVVRYEPRKRTSRKGKPLTKNEIAIIEGNRTNKVDPVHTARLLQREVKDIAGDPSHMEVHKALEAKFTGAPTLDLIWAHRYIYFVYKKPIISDDAYDKLVKEEIEFAGVKGYATVKDHRGWPQYIRSLAIYLIERQTAQE